MKLLIDTNVVLDVLLKREPFCEAAINVLNLAKRNDVQEFISATAITDIYYIACRQLKNKGQVRALLKNLLTIVSVAGVTGREIFNALELDWNDFEDSVQYSVAFLQEIDGIITRNPTDYKASEIQVWMPEQAVSVIEDNTNSLHFP